MIAVAILSFIIFLFFAYQLGRDDFVFLRKNVSIEQIFNSIFLGFFVAIFTARLAYIAFHPSIKFLNPLVFLALPYFPGLSFLGGVAGLFGFSFAYFYQRKLPSQRLLDMYTVSFFSAWTCYLFFQAAFDSVLHNAHTLSDSIMFVLSCVIALFLSLRFRIGKIVDGSIYSLGIFLFAINTMLWSVVLFSQTHQPFLTPEFIATGVFGAFGLGIFFKKLFYRKRALKK